MIVCFDGSLNNHDNYGGENLKKNAEKRTNKLLDNYEQNNSSARASHFLLYL